MFIRVFVIISIKHSQMAMCMEASILILFWYASPSEKESNVWAHPQHHQYTTHSTCETVNTLNILDDDGIDSEIPMINVSKSCLSTSLDILVWCFLFHLYPTPFSFAFWGIGKWILYRILQEFNVLPFQFAFIVYVQRNLLSLSLPDMISCWLQSQNQYHKRIAHSTEIDGILCV